MDWGALPHLGTALAHAAAVAFSAAARFSGFFSAAFALASLAAALKLFRFGGLRPASSGARPLPAVTILKPLKGRDRGLYENLASFCSQDYPEFQLVFCAADSDDPALRAVERLRREFPEADISMATGSRDIGCNPKVNNLAGGYPLAKHGLILISDSDVRVERDFLRRAVAPMADASVGLVSCFYRSGPARGLWGALEALAVNAQFLPQALVAGAFGMRFAMGAAMLVRRSALEALGGLSILAGHIADDFVLGDAMLKAGYKVEFSDAPVELVAESPSLGAVLSHQVREARVIRLCQPGGYYGMLVLHGFSLLSLRLLLLGPDPASAGLWAAVWAAKSFSVIALHRHALGRELGIESALLLPLSDWLAFGTWLAGLRTGRVVWRGESYALERSGRMVPSGALR